MQDAFGRVQSLLLLGGSSELGAAIAERLVADGCRHVVLAGRHADAMAPVAERLRKGGATTADVIVWDAVDVAGHARLVPDALAALPGGADLDCVVLAAGVLGDQADLDAHPAHAADLVAANFGGAASTLLHVAERVKVQGHGTIVVLSSVAGERVRKANFTYGATKAGLDAFAQGLGDALVEHGGRVLVVRPGWVATKMTEGMAPAPFATTPGAVADVVARGLASGAEVVWAPPILRLVFGAFRHLPRPLWRRVAATR